MSCIDSVLLLNDHNLNFNSSLSVAKLVLHEILIRWRYNGFALVHYGFVIKNLEQDYENAVIYLREGIETNEPGTQDGRFYFNLGDALQRLGRNEEASEVNLKLFFCRDLALMV